MKSLAIVVLLSTLLLAACSDVKVVEDNYMNLGFELAKPVFNTPIDWQSIPIIEIPKGTRVVLKGRYSVAHENTTAGIALRTDAPDGTLQVASAGAIHFNSMSITLDG